MPVTCCVMQSYHGDVKIYVILDEEITIFHREWPPFSPSDNEVGWGRQLWETNGHVLQYYLRHTHRDIHPQTFNFFSVLYGQDTRKWLVLGIIASQKRLATGFCTTHCRAFRECPPMLMTRWHRMWQRSYLWCYSSLTFDLAGCWPMLDRRIFNTSRRLWRNSPWVWLGWVAV